MSTCLSATYQLDIPLDWQKGSADPTVSFLGLEDLGGEGRPILLNAGLNPFPRRLSHLCSCLFSSAMASFVIPRWDQILVCRGNMVLERARGPVRGPNILLQEVSLVPLVL